MRLVRQSEKPQVSSSEIAAGSSTDIRQYSPNNIRQMIEAHESAAVDAVPVGAMLEWSSSTAPTNYLICYGQSLSVNAYSSLYAVIGSAFGDTKDSQNNVTHFNLPPAGLFYRAFYPNSSNDPDRASRTAVAAGGNSGDNVGSFQSDSIKAHSHGLKLERTDTDGGGHVPDGGFVAAFIENATGSQQTGGGLLTDRAPNVLSHSTESITGSETRPANINVYKIIRFQ